MLPLFWERDRWVRNLIILWPQYPENSEKAMSRGYMGLNPVPSYIAYKQGTGNLIKEIVWMFQSQKILCGKKNHQSEHSLD